jgi:hypothetical protein
MSNDFFVQDPQEDHNFSLVYRTEDFSFDIEPLDGTAETSIMINELQLEIDCQGRIIYVWGLCPLIKYKEATEFPYGYKKASLVFVLDKPHVLGRSYRLNEDRRWPIYINKKKDWVCLGNPTIKDMCLIEFAPKCVVTMNKQELIAVWLHPKQLPL